MILLTGAAFQGKLAYLRNVLKVPEEDIFFCRADDFSLDWSKKAICGLHLYVKAALAAGLDPIEQLALQPACFSDRYLLCDNIGGGIVPLTAEDRLWRETNGRVLQYLARKADSVWEFVCGFAVLLKGDPPC